MPPNPRPYDVIAFDLDGTLVDTAALHIAATHAAMREIYGASAAPERVARSLGNPLPESMRIVSGDPARVMDLCAAFLRYYAEHEADGAQCFPETFTVLDTLRDAGIGLAILSNKLRAWGVVEIDRLGLAPYFAHAVFMEDMPAPKPSGLALRPIMESFACPPGRIIVIGDSVGDIACAQAAGTLSGAALWGAHDPAPLLAAAPTYTFAQMRDVLATL